MKDDLPFAMSRPVCDAAPWSDASDARQSFRMALEATRTEALGVTYAALGQATTKAAARRGARRKRAQLLCRLRRL